MKLSNFTSSLPVDLLSKLDMYAKEFKIPKNQILEQALRAYFENLKKAEYAHSFKRASGSAEMISMAEKGLADYLKILEEK